MPHSPEYWDFLNLTTLGSVPAFLFFLKSAWSKFFPLEILCDYNSSSKWINLFLGTGAWAEHSNEWKGGKKNTVDILKGLFCILYTEHEKDRAYRLLIKTTVERPLRTECFLLWWPQTKPSWFPTCIESVRVGLGETGLWDRIILGHVRCA